MTDPPSAAIAVRRCTDGDVAAVSEIYAYHVRHGLASFEIEPPNEDEMRKRRADVISKGFPYFVAECQGEVVGYAYASSFRARPGYRYTAENSVYLRPGWEGRGIGKRLMIALLAECETIGLRQIVAVIGDSANAASIALHRSLGFTMVGTLRSVGYKFDHWVDTVLMQRALGPGDAAPP
jgi:L-amino acid N-acyltransferase YncA